MAQGEKPSDYRFLEKERKAREERKHDVQLEIPVEKPEGFIWEEPPPIKQNSPPWKLGAGTDVSQILALLKSRPGEWARVWTGGGYGAQNRVDLLREAGCETRTTRVEERGSSRHVYARWLG